MAALSRLPSLTSLALEAQSQLLRLLPRTMGQVLGGLSSLTHLQVQSANHQTSRSSRLRKTADMWRHVQQMRGGAGFAPWLPEGLRGLRQLAALDLSESSEVCSEM